MSKKIVSIFSGIDCLSLGAVGEFDSILAVEKEKKACETLTANKEKYHPNLEVRNIDIFEITDDEILSYKGIADGVVGGPPCQAFSSAKGSFNPEDERIECIDEYVRWIRLIEPKFFLFENTDGIVSGKKKKIFDRMISDLESLGYDVHFRVLNAHDYGNAQKRKRAIAIGFKSDINIDFEFPLPVENKKYVRDILDDNETISEYKKFGPKYSQLMPHVPEGGCWRHLPNEDLKKLALGKNYEKREGGMTGICRRLHRDKPCPTLVALGPQHNKTSMAHPTENRFLSITEYQRGQGIPDDYKIIGTLDERYKFIGNGVPVELAREIFKSINKAFSKFEHTTGNYVQAQDKSINDNPKNNMPYIEYNCKTIVEDNNQISFIF